MADSSELKRVFDKQAINKSKVALSTAAERKQKLAGLREAVLRNVEGIKKALYQDIGKPMNEEVPFEAGAVVVDIDDAINNLDVWMQPTPVPVQNAPAGASAYIKYEPRGQVLILSAWNFPFALALSPLVAAIAAGNTAIIKANEMGPATGQIIAKIIAECFSEDEVAVFAGDVKEAIALQELPFDHVFFTGSPEVGKAVMTAAAKNLASVTLELGGKCPAIVGPTCDMDAMLNNVSFGRTFNLGQTCLCIDYAIVPESLRDRFIEGVAEKLKAMFYQGGTYNKDANSRIVDARNLKRVKGYIDDAVTRGATIAFGGGVDEQNLIIEPTVLLDVPADAQIMKQEIFGPVLPVVTYRSQDEAVAIVNARPKPLGLYIFSDDDAFVEYVLARTSSGGVTVNGWAAHYFELGLPFGGVNHSGHGSYHGMYGFRELSHARSVYKL